MNKLQWAMFILLCLTLVAFLAIFTYSVRDSYTANQPKKAECYMVQSRIDREILDCWYHYQVLNLENFDTCKKIITNLYCK